VLVRRLSEGPGPAGEDAIQEQVVVALQLQGPWSSPGAGGAPDQPPAASGTRARRSQPHPANRRALFGFVRGSQSAGLPGCWGCVLRVWPVPLPVTAP